MESFIDILSFGAGGAFSATALGVYLWFERDREIRKHRWEKEEKDQQDILNLTKRTGEQAQQIDTLRTDLSKHQWRDIASGNPTTTVEDLLSGPR